MKGIGAFGLAALCLAATPVLALDQGEYRLNGFGTLGLTYLGGEQDGRSYGAQGQITDSWRGDAVSKLGGQLVYGLTDRIDVTAQAIAKAQQDSWEANLEWLFLSYHATDRLVVRAGRLRSPVYMYSDSLDVGFTYPWLRLPDEVYNQIQSPTYEGADAIYTLPLSYGSVAFQLAAGQSTRDNFVLGDMQEVKARNSVGGAITLETNAFGTLRVGYEQSDVSATLDPVIDTRVAGVQRVVLMEMEGQKSRFGSIGYRYDNGTWLTSNEVTRLDSGGDGDATEAFYLMGGRRFGDFLPHLTYAQLDEDGGRQRSWKAGLNYNLLPNIILKSEYQRVRTTRAYPGVFSLTAQEAYDNGLYSQTGGMLGTPARSFDADILSVGIDFVF